MRIIYIGKKKEVKKEMYLLQDFQLVLDFNPLKILQILKYFYRLQLHHTSK